MGYNSKDCSWLWLTASGVVATRECDLISVYIVPSAAAAEVNVYSGQSTAGDVVARIEEATKSGQLFNPPVPIYCRKGIYVDLTTNITGVLIQWCNLVPGE